MTSWGIKIENQNDIVKALHEIFKNDIKVISNRKRKCKREKKYLYCGGGYDTETTTIKHTETINNIDYMRPDFAFVYHYQIMINGVYIYGRDFNKIVPLFAMLVKHIQENYPDTKLIIWVANLSYEWAFFKRQLASIGITKIFAKTERKILMVEMADCIEFRECIGLFGNSLAKIAKTYTKTQKAKGDLDYNKIRTPETEITDTEEGYCYTDVKILDELSYIAFDMFTLKYLDIPLTGTGILRQDCKKKIKNIKWEYERNLKLMPENETIYNIFRQYLYAGGYAHSNVEFAGITLENVICADLKSDYPAQMNHKKFPSGELLEITNLNECYTDDNISYIGVVRLFGVNAKTAHTYISMNKIFNPKEEWVGCIFDNGRLIKGDNIVLVLNEVDLKAVELMYNIDKMVIERAWKFTKQSTIPKFLRDTMNEYYIKKEELGNSGYKDKIEYIESKRKVNAVYGMTATRLYLNEYYFDEKEKDIKEREKTDYNTAREKVWLNPYIGYWTTSYARLIICYFCSKFPDAVVQYDTDSLYIRDCEQTKDILEEIEKYNINIRMTNHKTFDDRNMLNIGTWELSKPYKKFKGLGAKRYIVEKQDGTIKPTIAGCNSQSLVKYCNERGLDVFNYFKHNMLLRCADSDKLTVDYYDGDIMLKKVTDYNGNTSIVEVGTYAALYEIPFKMTLKEDYQTLIKRWRKYNDLL